MTSRENKSRNPRMDVLPRVPAWAGTSPREIDVHIEELVLHGFTPAGRWHLTDALEAELRELLLERGVPTAWHGSPGKLEGGAIPATRLTNPTTTGAQIARAAFNIRDGSKLTNRM